MEEPRIDDGLQPIARDRRDFLKRSAMAGAVVWSAPVIASLPGSTAWAQQYPPSPCDCQEEAQALRLTATGLVNLNVATPLVTGDAGTNSVATINAGTLLTASVLSATTSNCNASASVADVSLFLGTLNLGIAGIGLTLPTIRLLVLPAEAHANGGCPTGSSSIAQLFIGGSLVTVGTAPNTSVTVRVGTVVLGTIILNEQTTTCVGGQEALTVNAAHVTLNILNLEAIDLVISHARVAGCNCPCT